MKSTEIIADTSRSDIDEAHRTGANHEYESTIRTSTTGSQRVCTYAINVGVDDNVLLGCRTVTIAAGGANGSGGTIPVPSGGRTGSLGS